MKNNKQLSLNGLLVCSVLWALSTTTWAQNVIRLNEPQDGNGRYAVQMLNLALSRIDTKYKLEMRDAKLETQARNMEDVASGRLDIFWTATDAELEEKLLPIRIPLYKGLLGHRIFIIRKGDQSRFDRVRNFEDLKQFKFGQGTTWADTRILEANGLTVVKTIKYEGLFYMLDGERFDAYPRGVQEPWQELITYSQLPLAVENKIMLVYQMPFYLFTSKENKKLAADLEKGFNIAIADGGFDEIFYNSPVVQSVAENAGIESRMVFRLKNPNLSKETPVDRPELWLDIEEFRERMKQRKQAQASVSNP